MAMVNANIVLLVKIFVSYNLALVDEAKMQAPEESAQAQEEDTVMQSAVELPACELRNLPQLSELFNEGATVIQKKQLAQALLAQVLAHVCTQ